MRPLLSFHPSPFLTRIPLRTASILPGEGAETGPHVLLFRKFDAPRIATSVADAAGLEEWISSLSLPLVARLDQEPKNRAILQRVFEFKAPKFVGFTPMDGSEGPFVAAVEAAAAAHPALKFLVGDSATNEGALNFFGLKAADMPAAVIHDNVGADKKYTKTGVTASDLEAFISEFEAGSLAATVKSEEIPAENSGPVTVLVGKTFESVVQPGKTILLEFYAPVRARG